MRKPALLISMGLHTAATLILLVAAAVAPRVLPPPHHLIVELRERVYAPLPPRPTQGGGSQASKMVARQGRPPARPASRVFIPPMIERNQQPQLVLQPALLTAPDFSANLAVIGDPLGIPGGEGGLRGLGGIGNHGPGGVGDGPEPGFGSARPLPDRITRQPQLIYKEEPEYSEAARKAHFQGVVRLRIDVGVDGRPTNVRVVQGVGLGLDENAVAAVLKWQFRPAMAGDQAVVAPALIEVGFRLL